MALKHRLADTVWLGLLDESRFVAAATTAAVLVYRLILFWLSLLVGAVAFISLRGLNGPDRPEPCVVPPVT